MSALTDDNIVSASKWGASTFVANYYNALDQNRQELTKLFKDWTTIVWNGVKYPLHQYYLLFQKLPQSKHEVESVDVQPIIFSKTLNTLLVTVTGNVLYNNDNGTKRLFTQNFILTMEQQQWFIASENFRWIAPCTKRIKSGKEDQFNMKKRING